MRNNLNPSPPWYHHWWGVVALGAAIFFIVAALFVAGLTGWYWWQIRRGHTIVLEKPSDTSFTASIHSTVIKPGSVDRAALETTDAPTLGRQGAPVIIVEFVDFKCPNCKAAAPIMRQLLAKYGGVTRLIIRHIPVESAHPGATRLAEFAWCAHNQGRFWPAYDLLFTSQDTISDNPTREELINLGAAAGLDNEKLTACLASPEAGRKIKIDYFDALRFGVRGTPTFFINGEKVEGVIPLSVWEKYFTTIIPAIK